MNKKYHENIDQEWQEEPCPEELYNAIDIQKTNPLEAIKEFEQLGKKGSLLSLVYLGDAYCNGRGVDRDIDRGQKYYEKAASLGSIEAYHRMAFWLWCHDNVEKTVQILTYTSRKGFSPAMFLLGLLYTSGKYITKDFNKG